MRTSSDTAQRVRDVALELFMVHGYAGLSMQEVRRHAGVSNGSLYHHFPHKADLVADLRVDGMRQAQDIILAAVGSARSAQEVVDAAVRDYLRWVQAHRELASLLFADVPDDVLLAAEPVLAGDNRRYVHTVSEWLTEHARAGAVVDVPFEIAHALWLGPTQEFCRHWLRGRARRRPTQAAAALAAGAWRAMSAPSTAQHSRSQP